MYSQQLRRSVALATGAVVAGEAAARLYYQRRGHQEQHPHPEQGRRSALLRLLEQRLTGPEPLPLPLPLDRREESERAWQRQQRTAAFLLGGRPPAGCDAAAGSKGGKKSLGLDEYHAVPLPATDAAQTAEIVARFKSYVAARDLDAVGSLGGVVWGWSSGRAWHG